MSTKGFYAASITEYAKGNIRPLTDTLRVYLIRTSLYTVNLGSHQFLSSITSGRIGFDTLASKTITSGVFDAADCSIANPLNFLGDAIVIVQWTGSDATSRLLFYDDTIASSSADPVTVAWDNGANKIWKMAG